MCVCTHKNNNSQSKELSECSGELLDNNYASTDNSRYYIPVKFLWGNQFCEMQKSHSLNIRNIENLFINISGCSIIM